MKALSAFGLFALLAAGAWAAEPKISRIDVIDYGIYTVKVPKGSGKAHVERKGGIGDVKHVKSTRDIPAKLGVQFGFRYGIVGTPKHAKVTFKTVVTFPPAGLHDPASTETIKNSEVVLTKLLDAGMTYSGYEFDDPWELVPGAWTIELWDGNRKLASETFSVFKPK
jgi:hypothetical protein